MMMAKDNTMQRAHTAIADAMRMRVNGACDSHHDSHHGRHRLCSHLTNVVAGHVQRRELGPFVALDGLADRTSSLITNMGAKHRQLRQRAVSSDCRSESCCTRWAETVVAKTVHGTKGSMYIQSCCKARSESRYAGEFEILATYSIFVSAPLTRRASAIAVIPSAV